MDRAIQKRWWQQRRWQLLGAALVAILLIALLVTSLGGPRALAVSGERLSIAAVSRGTFNDFVPLRARVVPRETVYLDAIEGGRVEKVFVEPGDVVTAGQDLVRLSNTELELVVLDREARLIESITQLQARQTQLEQDRLNNEKALATIEFNIARLQRAARRRESLSSVAQETRDNLAEELEYNQRLQPLQAESNARQETLRVQQLPQIAAQLQKLHEDVEITRSKLASLMVRAPVGGRMTAIDLKIGENRNRGERLGELTPELGFKLTAAVDEYYLGRLREGMSASVEVDRREWPMRVARIHPQVRDGAFNVDLDFAGEIPQRLVPGQAVQGKFALGTASEAVILPTGPFLQQSGGDWVFVLDADGDSATRRRIELGRRNVEQLEVVSGLAPGERVVISDYTGYERIQTLRID
jgi:HlyD family secretion protein